MKILVTGATGFLGRHVVRALLKRNHQVRALVRPGTAESPFGGDSPVELFCSDLRGSADLLPAFDGVDVVIHLAAVVCGSDDAQLAGTVAGTERLLEAMSRSTTRRLVLASTLSVYDWSAPWFSLTEDTPLESRARLYRRDGYAISKTWQERIVRRVAESQSWNLIVLRPGFIWGPGRAWCISAGIDLGRFRLINGPLRRLPLTHVNNCAEAFALAAEKTETQTSTLNVIDTEEVRAWRFATDHQKASREKRSLIPVPYHLWICITYLAAMTGRVLFGVNCRLPTVLNPLRYRAMFRGLRFPNHRISEQLCWKPGLDYEACVKQSHGSEKNCV